MGKEDFVKWFNQNWWQTKEIIGEVPFNFIIELTWKWIDKNFVPLELPVSQDFCGWIRYYEILEGYHYETDCGHGFVVGDGEKLYKDFKYCIYCGKKIRVSKNSG